MTCFVGSHVSALPLEVLAHPDIDLVLLNEGVYALHNLLKTDLKTGLDKVKGIGHKSNGAPQLNAPEIVVPQERMDADLPGYAWDLLPFRQKPLDLYRAHFWHAEFNHDLRTPFAAIYTSLGCKFKCDFCMINIVNRVDNADGTVSAASPTKRFWSPGFIIGEFEKLAKLGVETIRVSDEMFFLNKNYYEPLLTSIVDRGYKFRMWTYSRIDTVRPNYLDLFRRAGIGWLALGVEAASQVIRREVSKGSFQEVNIRQVAKTIQDHGMNIISNYIFGFPDDTQATMQQTLDLALELNTEMVNMYPCQALPGSPALQHRPRERLGGAGFLRRLRISFLREPAPANPPLHGGGSAEVSRPGLAEIFRQPGVSRSRGAEIRLRPARECRIHGEDQTAPQTAR